MSGTLFLCATPIGNLGDITQRVRETLMQADLIAAEDTRNSLKIINHFDIHTPMTSYHEYNKYDKAEELIGMLQTGKDIALITDAGTPAISDPGEVLVQRCAEEGIPVTSLPGPSAVITALTLSGLNTGRFCFEGFLPRENKLRKERLEELKEERRTIVLYEAPHHLQETLKDLLCTLGDRRISVCRELTKKHEEILRFSLSGAVSYFEENKPRGEFVLVTEGKSPEEIRREKAAEYESLSVREHVEQYEAKGHDRKSAMKLAAADRGVSKREIYNELLKEDKE